MKFLPKDENNLCLRCEALRIWRMIGDVPGWFVRAIRFDISFSPRLSLSNYGQRGIDTDSSDPRGELAGLTKSSQVRVGAKQRFLQSIFGILVMTDNTKNLLSGNLSVPPAELSKSFVVTQLSRLDKIIIGTLGQDRRFLGCRGSAPLRMPGFESAGYVSSAHHGSP
jgi:hypothetical protein